ncbi:phage antirepressor N-terminal domain-containing protein [Dactylosporangium sp. NPDC000244]|uniref:phage antirepressor N-terminal domain-containing protein n=1 Tax=Dactylosporangium sp. NPDC000244 TaxID=3154365 RepID=UPI003332445D
MNTIVRIPFHGSEVLAVDVDGKPNVVLKPAFEAIGLDADQQIRKLKRQTWAGTGVTTVPTAGGVQQMVTADLRTFLMALATIPASRVNEAARPLLVAYQSEVADAIEAYWTQGGAINPRATDAQIEQVQETLDEIAKRRLAERMDYKAILNYLKLGGAVDDEYAHVQNTLYLLLFGRTAATIRATQPQRTGVVRRRGEGFRKSTVAKDYLTEDQLALLNATVLATVAQISLHFPHGASAGQMLEAIGRAVGILAPAQLAVTR